MTTSGITPNRSYLEKADLALANLMSEGGYLLPAQADKFMRLLIKQSRLMGLSTVTPMKSHTQYIDKIRFNERILRAGYEGLALPEADRSMPDLSKTELNAKLFKAEVRLTNETLEDNIERENLRETIMQLMSDAIARDVEEVALQGDTTSADPFLAQLDGLLKQSVTNIVDAGNQPLSKTLFRDMIRSIPKEFLRNKAAMRFLTSTDAEINYRDALADRIGPLGDQYLTEDTTISALGIPVLDLQMMPENIGTNSACTDMLFTDPKNINFGIWRNIRIETDKLVREGVLLIVASLRFDVMYAEETAVVKAININLA